MKTQELTINGEMFDEMRNNLDVAMKILINRMIATRIGKGAVSAKIAITMKEFILCLQTLSFQVWKQHL